jgi:hypothetical protein
MCMGNSLVNDELEDKSKSRDDIVKTRKGLVSEAMHNSSVSRPGLEFVLRMMLTMCAVGRFRRPHKISKSDYWLCHVFPSVRPSVRPPAWSNSATAKRTLTKFDIC